MNHDQRNPAAHAADTPGSPRRRRPWLAAVLSLAATGLGQLYNGQWRKALAFFAAELLLALAMIPAMATFAGLAISGSALVAFNLAAAMEAYRTARRGRFVPARFNRWWVYVLAVLLGGGAGAAVEGVIKGRYYVNYKVPSGSMVPTLVAGDRFMAARLGPETAVERGQVVVFVDEDSGRHFVKRVVALPGEVVHGEDRTVFVDGRPLDEPYARHEGGVMVPGRDGFAPLRLATGQYFLMGDNREHSYDSRWLGPVPRERIVARALYVYLPGAPPGGGEGRGTRLGETVR